MDKLKQESRELIVRLYRDENLSIDEVAKKSGHGRNTIHRIIKVEGIVRSKNKFSKDVELEIVKCYEDGNSLAYLGKQYDCDLKTIHYIVKRHGVKCRRRGGVSVEISEQEEAELISDWKNGISKKNILEKYNISEITLKKILALYGEKGRGGIVKPVSDENELLKDWNSEMFSKDILKKHNISRKTLTNFVSSKGLKKRHEGLTGSSHGYWKGGMFVNKAGYKLLWIASTDRLIQMASTQGYVLEHRLVMAEYLGRPLTKDESVHHIDGNRQNNSIENLQLRIGQHGSGQAYCCADCGSRNLNPIPLD